MFDGFEEVSAAWDGATALDDRKGLRNAAFRDPFDFDALCVYGGACGAVDLDEEEPGKMTTKGCWYAKDGLDMFIVDWKDGTLALTNRQRPTPPSLYLAVTVLVHAVLSID